MGLRLKSGCAIRMFLFVNKMNKTDKNHFPALPASVRESCVHNNFAQLKK
jgi:hypothetical protein